MFREDDGGFAIGVGRVKIASDDIRFVTDVVGDLGRLVYSAEGEDVLQRGDALGQNVRIVKPQPPTEPPNGWIVPDDIAAAASPGVAIGGAPSSGRPTGTGTGAGCGSTIVYDPADWPRRGDPSSLASSDVLLLLLRQANANAAGASDPSKPDWGDNG